MVLTLLASATDWHMAYACIKCRCSDSGKSNQLVSFRPTVRSGALQDIASSLVILAAGVVVMIGTCIAADTVEYELAKLVKRRSESLFSRAVRRFRGWARRQLTAIPVLYCFCCHQRYPIMKPGIWCHSGRHFFCRRCFSVSMRLLGFVERK
jgi:hypothetical protein